MKKSNYIVIASALAITALTAGCAAGAQGEEDVEGPSATLDGLEPQQSVSDNGWTANATLTVSGVMLEGWAYFTRTSGPSTRFAGACLVRQYLPAKTCVGDGYGHPAGSECNSYPTSLPSGGARYCLAPNGSGAKYCHYRPGNATAYCAGSPKTGQPISPSTLDLYRNPEPVGTNWVTMACFEQCSSVVPSVSPTGTTHVEN